MAIELTEEPPEPVVPDGLVVDELRADEYEAFYDALNEAFAEHWEWHPKPFEAWLERRQDQHRDEHGPVWFVVRDGDELAAVTRNDASVAGGGYVGAIGVRPAWRGQGLAKALLQQTFARVLASRHDPRHARRRCSERDRRSRALRAGGHARRDLRRRLREGARMSLLRARCPDCRTLTAVAIDDGYECHSCGRTFRAGLVRVPRAWGDGGEAMVEAASLALDYPEVAVVEEETLAMQTLAVASDLPVRPLVLGGCCCSHIGAVEGLAARHGRVAVLWLDAHGDLNTPETSPSGNEWGMPLRDAASTGARSRPADVVLWGARNLDPPEEEFIAATGIDDDPGALLDRAEAVYVALDCDVLDPGELAVFMPEPGGPSLGEVEQLLARVRESGKLVGAGFTGLAPDPANVEKLGRLAAALGY